METTEVSATVPLSVSLNAPHTITVETIQEQLEKGSVENVLQNLARKQGTVATLLLYHCKRSIETAQLVSFLRRRLKWNVAS
jgi:uncharacterized Zn finger protein